MLRKLKHIFERPDYVSCPKAIERVKRTVGAGVIRVSHVQLRSLRNKQQESTVTILRILSIRAAKPKRSTYRRQCLNGIRTILNENQNIPYRPSNT